MEPTNANKVFTECCYANMEVPISKAINDTLRKQPDGVHLLDIKYQITEDKLESALLILKYNMYV